MSSTCFAGCSSPLSAMKRYDSPSPFPLLLCSPLCVADSRSPPLAAMKRKKRENAIADVGRRLDFDSELNCSTPPPSRNSTENVSVAVRRRLDFDSAFPPPPRKSRANVAGTVGRKLDFDSDDVSTTPRPWSFESNAVRRYPPPAFPAVRWNRRAMKSYFNNLAPINLR